MTYLHTAHREKPEALEASIKAGILHLSVLCICSFAIYSCFVQKCQKHFPWLSFRKSNTFGISECVWQSSTLFLGACWFFKVNNASLKPVYPRCWCLFFKCVQVYFPIDTCVCSFCFSNTELPNAVKSTEGDHRHSGPFFSSRSSEG